MVPGLHKPSGTPSGVAQPTFKNKKGIRAQPYNYVKNQSVQITGGEESLGSTLTAHEAATFYMSAMNTQQILNSRRQPRRFGAGSTGNNNNNMTGTTGTAKGSGAVNNNVGMNGNGAGGPESGQPQMTLGPKLQNNKFKSNASPTAFTKTFY